MAGLSKLHSTCSEDPFGKNNFRKSFIKLLQNLSEKISAWLSKRQYTSPEEHFVSIFLQQIVDFSRFSLIIGLWKKIPAGLSKLLPTYREEHLLF